jgi:hypothetical protein
MVVAMAIGMAVFGVLFVSPVDPFGYREALRAHPYTRECLMLIAMSVPMVGYMLQRGHGARRTTEMQLGMSLPAVAVIGLTATSSVPLLTVAALPIWSHVAMLLGMLAAMLYRRAEYASAHHHQHEPASAPSRGEHNDGMHHA